MYIIYLFIYTDLNLSNLSLHIILHEYLAVFKVYKNEIKLINQGHISTQLWLKLIIIKNLFNKNLVFLEPWKKN